MVERGSRYDIVTGIPWTGGLVSLDDSMVVGYTSLIDDKSRESLETKMNQPASIVEDEA